MTATACDLIPLPRAGALLSDWEQLTAAHAQTPFAEPFWQRAWHRHFSGSAPGELLWQPGGLALAVQRSGGATRRLAALFNPHVPLVECVFGGSPHDMAGLLLSAAAHRCDLLELPKVEPDAPWVRAIVDRSTQRGVRLIWSDEPGNLRIGLAAGWAQTRADLSRNILQGTERKRRQLERLGALHFTCVQKSGTLPALLEECFAVERASWKGAAGSAIASNPATRGFYTDVALAAAQRGMLAIYLLRLDERLIAFEYCLRRAGVIHLLKLGYLPELSPQSPGNILRLLLLEHACAAGDRIYDFGIDSEWKRRWTDQLHPLKRLTLYMPHWRGSAAYLLGPVLRTAIKSSPLVAGFLRRRHAAQSAARAAERAALKAQVRESSAAGE